MKKLIVFLSIIAVSLTASSQTGTKNSTDTTVMCLPTSVMKEVVKDILRKDSLESENKLLWKNSDILTNQLKLKDAQLYNRDSLIRVKNFLIASKDTVISLKDQQLTAQKDLNAVLQKDIKKQKNKTLWSNVGSGSIIVALVLLLAWN